MSLQVLVSVYWSSSWRGCRWNRAMSNSRLEHIYKTNSFHRAKFGFFSAFLVCMGTTKVFVSVSLTLGAEDLCPSLQPWVRPVPHRTAKELHLHPASFRFIVVLQWSQDSCCLAPAALSPSLSFWWTSFQWPSWSNPWHSIVPESEKHSAGKRQVISMWEGSEMSLTNIYSTWHFYYIHVFFYTQEVARLLFTDTIFIKGDTGSADLVPATMG